MANKYITQDEAATRLGVRNDELNKYRESGQLRGFADRGTWKYKEEDIDEFKRRRAADSDPEVPLSGLSASVLAGDDDVVSSQPTVIRKGGGAHPSDSDVRLVYDETIRESLSGEVPLPVLPSLHDSDSDVRLISDSVVRGKGRNSDSDVKIVGAESDSDIRLAPSGIGSDSDVKLVGDSSKSRGRAPSDSDVKLIGDAPSARGGFKPADANMPLELSDDGSGVSIFHDESGIGLGDEDDPGRTLSGSGISLEKLVDSGISLESRDSGISLERHLATPDSGLALEGSDSGLTLESPGSAIRLSESDSGLVLEDAGDSGLALEPGDSGISLASPSDSGISLADSGSGMRLGAADSGLSLENTAQTIPMLGADEDEETGDRTQVEIPQFSGGDDTEFEFGGTGAGGGKDVTSVIMFDDEEEVDDRSQTVVKKKDEEEDEFDVDDFEEDLEVTADVIGEDDELDDEGMFDDEEGDGLGGDEEDELAGAGAARYVEAPPAEWGVLAFLGLFASTGLLVACGVVMFDLVRAMWGWSEPGVVSSTIIDQIGGLF